MWSYGEDCQFPCSRRCINQTCDRFNGTCISLCEIRNGGNCDQGISYHSFYMLSTILNDWFFLGLRTIQKHNLILKKKNSPRCYLNWLNIPRNFFSPYQHIIINIFKKLKVFIFLTTHQCRNAYRIVFWQFFNLICNIGENNQCISFIYI